MTSRIFRRTTHVLSATLLFITLASSQELIEKTSFEGVVGFEVRDLQSVESVTLFMKNGRLRLEGTDRGGDNAILLDYRLKKAFVIISARDQYVELPAVAVPSKSGPSKPSVEVQKTDLTDEILDYTCDQFLITSDKFTMEVWATKGFGTAGTFLTPQVTESAWKILEMGYFPMRIISKDSTGEESGRIEVASVQKKSLSSSLFRIPSSYEKLDPEALQAKQPPKKRKR
jgi:hypothetical protein